MKQFPAGTEVEMEESECAPQLTGQIHVERQLFSAWLDSKLHLCGKALLYHAENMQRDEMRGGTNGDGAFDFCYRSMYQRDLPKTSSACMGAQDLANYVLYLIEEKQLPPDVIKVLEEGAMKDLQDRNKTIQSSKDYEEMMVRWIKQKIHGELDETRGTFDLPDDLEMFTSFEGAEQQPYTAEAEEEARRMKVALLPDIEQEPPEEERDRMLAEMATDMMPWSEDDADDFFDDVYTHCMAETCGECHEAAISIFVISTTTSPSA